MELSKYQKDIITWVKEGKGNAVINATAGSSKSFTLLEICKQPNVTNGILLAYNTHIAKHLNEKIGRRDFEAKTNHSLGRSLVASVLGNKLTLNADKYKSLCKEDVEDWLGPAVLERYKERNKNRKSGVLRDYEINYRVLAILCKAVSLTQNTLGGYSTEDIANLDEHFVFTDNKLDIKYSEIAKVVERVINEGISQAKRINLISYEDMLYLPYVWDIKSSKYDWVLCDELQDFSPVQFDLIKRLIGPDTRFVGAGDTHQCLHEDTIINLFGNITKKIKDVVEGDLVISSSGQSKKGPIVSKRVSKVYKTFKSEKIYKINFEDGSYVKASKEHLFFATYKYKIDRQVVYLMYREGVGFRIGSSSPNKDGNIFHRMNSEAADKMWILNTCSTIQQARFLEDFYSYTYGIPKNVFKCRDKFQNQEFVDGIFSLIDTFSRADLLLKQTGLSFNNPHGTRNSYLQPYIRYSLNGGTSSSGDFISCHCSDLISDNKELFDALNFNISIYKEKRLRVRKECSTLEAMRCVEIFESKGLRVEKGTLVNGKFFNFTYANSLREGMLVPTQEGFKIIDSVEEEYFEGYLYDIDVEDNHSYLANDIWVHNSINSYIGSRIDSIATISQELNAINLPLSITYRLPPNHVKLVSSVCPHVDIEAFKTEDGKLEAIILEDFIKTLRTGDGVLARRTKDLVQVCLKTIGGGKKATVKGKDIGKGLVNLIGKVCKDDTKPTEGLGELLEAYFVKEAEKVKEKSKIEGLRDKIDSIHSCISFYSSSCVQDLCWSIEGLFTDKEEGIVFKSCHSQKGSEHERVFIINYFDMPLHWVPEDSWQYQQELNCRFVALTRSSRDMYFVAQDLTEYEYLQTYIESHLLDL